MRSRPAAPPMKWGDHLWRMVALAVLCAVLFFTAAGYRGLWEGGEVRHAEVAREMAAGGDWVTPRLNYAEYLERPALTYWAAALSFKLFGVSERSARLAPAFFATLCVLLTYLLASSLYNREAGFWAGICLATMAMFFVLARVPLADMQLLSAVLLTFWGAWELRQGHGFGLYAFWAGCAAGLLIKGLLGPGLPAGAVLIYCALAKEWGLVKKLANWRGMVLAAVIALPWIIWAGVIHPELIGALFIDEQLGGLFSAGPHHRQPFYYYLWVLPLAAFPWSVLAPWAIGRAWPGSTWNLPASRSWLFVMVWGGWLFVFICLARTKMMPYILPVLPALAIMIGAGLGVLARSGLRGETPHGMRATLTGLALAAMSFGLAPLLYPALVPGVGFNQMGVVMLLAPALGVAVGLGVFFGRSRRFMALAAPVGVFLVLMVCMAAATPVLDGYRSMAGLVKPLTPVLKRDDVLVNYGGDYYGTVFYSGRKVVGVSSRSGDKELARLMSNPRRRYVVISEDRAYERFAQVAKGRPGLLLFVWGRLGGKLVFSNRPE